MTNPTPSATSRLTFHIVFALILGLASGLILNFYNQVPFVQEYLIGGILHILGKIFIATLKMLVVPLVFVSLVCGVQGLDDVKKLGKIGAKTLGLYLFTTSLAVALGLTFALIINPGLGLNLTTNVQYAVQEAPSLSEILINLFPTNPIKSAAEGKMLQLIVFALLFGIGISLVGKQSKPVSDFLDSLNSVIMKMITIMMGFAPYGVYALITKVFAQQGLDAIRPLILYFITVLGALLLHLLGTYSFLLAVIAKINPLKFFKAMRSTLMFAFSTASSNATIPITLQTVTEKLNVPKSIASFTVPLGATINMDGTAIMQGVATVFISQVYNINIGVSGYLMVILTATLASIGTAGVPGVGLITLAMVLRQVGLPVEGIGLIMGVDRLLDMVRTAVNVFGDATVSCIVAQSDAVLEYEQRPALASSQS